MEITTFLKDGMSQTFIYLNYFYVKKVWKLSAQKLT
jgi:hypothetical protein